MLVGLRSRRQIADFVMHRPASVRQALALHAEPGVNMFMAGGIELIDWLKYGHGVDRVIRLDGIPELSEIAMTPLGLRIGAMATHAAITENPVVPRDLAGLWPQVANPRVRFTGTIGGNVLCGKADYDGLPALLALGARAAVASGDTVGLDAMDGLVTGFIVPEPSKVRLFADRSLRPALVVWLGLDVVDGWVGTVRVAVGMAHPKAVCVSRTLDGVRLADLGQVAGVVADDVAARLPEPVGDGRATASYRRRMVGVLTRRIMVRAGDAA